MGANRTWGLMLAALAAWLSLAACLASPQGSVPTEAPAGGLVISITADGQTQRFQLAESVTAREALALAGIAVSDTDRLSIPPFARLSDGDHIVVTRVRETTSVEQVVIPYSSRTVRNESLPTGEQRLVQAGANGLEELTYRTVFEDGLQTSRSVIRRVVLAQAVDEIVMVGAQNAFTAVPVTGTLAYLSAGSAWAARGLTNQRLLIAANGDLDGRVFSLSPDGQFLLYTRGITDTASEFFNQLYVVDIVAGGPREPIQLPATNVLWADWVVLPDSPPTIAYPSALKTDRAPGWQANNDLWLLSWAPNVKTKEMEFNPLLVLDTSSGGLYGWWGTGFAVAPDYTQIAYARTDGIGVVNLATYETRGLISFAAYNARSDWAWYPSLRWASSGWLYTVTHGAPLRLELPEDSPAFDITALNMSTAARLDLIPRAGMFANPAPSPITDFGAPQQIAYLQALEPDNSPFSNYRLYVMDADGSNARALFPPEDESGLAPGAFPTWSPDGRLIAIVSGGNLWLIDPKTGIAQQVTGDGLTSKIDWR